MNRTNFFNRLLTTITQNSSNFILNIDQPVQSKKLAILTSLLLSIGSGITTLNGLLYYVDVFLAIIIMLGIQALLLIAAWQVHSQKLSTQTRLSLMAALGLTMLISVFFSYSDLLDGIYTKESRVENEVQQVRARVVAIIEPIREDLVEDARGLAVQFQTALNVYDKSFNQTIGQKAEQIYAAQLKTIQDSLSVQERLQEEKDKLRKYKDEPAKRVKAERNIAYLEALLRKKRTTQQVNELKKGTIDEAQTLYNQAFELLNTSPDSISGQQLAQYDKAVVDYIKAVNHNISKKIDLNNWTLPDTLSLFANQLGTINDFMVWKGKYFDRIIPTSIDSLRQQLNTFISKVPHLTSEQQQKLLAVTTNVGKYGGEASHFALAYGALFWDFNILALFALILAFSIDTLILICGYVGQDRKVIPKEKKTKGIDNAIRTIFTTEYNAKTDVIHYDKVGRIITFLSQCDIHEVPSSKNAEVEYATAVYQSDIDKYGLTKEFAILNAHQLTKILSEDVFIITDGIIQKVKNLLDKETGFALTKKLELIKDFPLNQKTLSKVLNNLKIKDQVKVAYRITRGRTKSSRKDSSPIQIKEVIMIVAKNRKIGVQRKLVKWLANQMKHMEMAKNSVE